MTDQCLFCKIVAGTIPSKRVYEDDDFVVFNDIHPAAPVHLLIVPRLHIATLADCETQHRDLLGKMLALAPKLARDNGTGYVADPSGQGMGQGGFSVFMNTGPQGRQSVYHLHLHLLGGPQPWRFVGPG